MKNWIIRVLVLAAVAALAWGAATKWPEQTAKLAFWKTQTVSAKKTSRPTTATILVRDIHFAVNAAGDIGPADQVSVRPEISGRIDVLPVDIGDEVKSGELLFSLDDRDLQIERTQRLTEIEGAKLQLERAQRNYARAQKLISENLISQEVFEDTRTDFELARNSLERSQNSLNLVEDRLSRTRIVAPFDCTVLTRPVSVGQAVSGSSGVNSGTEVLTIANLSEMVILAHVNQSDVTRLRVGQKVEVEVEAVPGLKLTGHVDRIAPQATLRNNIKGFTTRILLRKPDERVRPGMTANLTIPLISVNDALAVPLGAVFTEQGERFVYVQRGQTFERRTIQIGVADYDFAEVQAGLEAGEIVSLVQPAEETGSATQAFSKGREKAAGNGGGKSGEQKSAKDAKSAGGTSGGSSGQGASSASAGK